MLWHREYTRESSHLRVSERPENKQRWIIDEEAAAVVRRIFRMVNDGKGVYQIADILSEEKVLCPSAYLAAKAWVTVETASLKTPTAGGVRR